MKAEITLLRDNWVELIKENSIQFYQKLIWGDFPGSPVVKISPFNTEGTRSTPGRGANHMPWSQKPKDKTETIL